MEGYSCLIGYLFLCATQASALQPEAAITDIWIYLVLYLIFDIHPYIICTDTNTYTYMHIHIHTNIAT